MGAFISLIPHSASVSAEATKNGWEDRGWMAVKCTHSELGLEKTDQIPAVAVAGVGKISWDNGR